jgi:TusA-related sulfurtransferase
MSDPAPQISVNRPDDTFDTNLPVCYEILLYLSSRLARLTPGDTLEFVTGDPTAADKIPPWCDARDYILLEHQTLANSKQRFLISR